MNINALNIAIQSKIPVIVWGGPGIGKSSISEGIARSLKCHIETVIASIREPADFGGLPVIGDDGGVKLAPPAWAKRIAAKCLDKNEDPLAAILFLDEISTAAPATQAALLRVIHDGVVGDLKLPPNMAIIAAANPPEEAAGGWELSPPMANRFIHLKWSHDAPSWCEGLVGGFPDPKVARMEPYDKFLPQARGLIASFINIRPALLYVLPKDTTNQGLAWPSPRTWETVTFIRASKLANHFSDEDEVDLAMGAVGEAAAIELFEWEKNLDLPNPEDLLQDAIENKLGGFSFPERGDKSYAILTSIVAAVLSNNTPDRWNAAWKIFKIAIDQGIPDVAASAARTLGLNRPKDEDGNLLPAPKEIAAFGALLYRARILT
jgi:hypothetical protein